jgi:Scramblase
MQEIEISAPPGTVVGSVKQNWSCLIPNFDIKDVTGTAVLKIKGPFITISCCKDVVFKVLLILFPY